jgi:hypothetical protein
MILVSFPVASSAVDTVMMASGARARLSVMALWRLPVRKLAATAWPDGVSLSKLCRACPSSARDGPGIGPPPPPGNKAGEEARATLLKDPPLVEAGAELEKPPEGAAGAKLTKPLPEEADELNKPPGGAAGAPSGFRAPASEAHAGSPTAGTGAGAGAATTSAFGERHPAARCNAFTFHRGNEPLVVLLIGGRAAEPLESAPGL